MQTPVQKAIASTPQLQATWFDKLLDHFESTHWSVEVIFLLIVGAIIHKYLGVYFRSKHSNWIPWVEKT